MATSFQLLVIGATSVLTIELCASSFLLNLPRLRDKNGTVLIAPTLLAAFNFVSIIYETLEVACLFVDETNCVSMSRADQIFSFFLSPLQNFLILYIAYIVSQYDKRVIAMFALLVLNSVAWGIADIILSGGFYDPILQLCDYSQNDLTGYGTVLADIACDLTATVIVILSVAQDITMGSNLAWGLLVRNVPRTALMLTANATFAYIILTMSDPFLTSVAFNIQAYFCARIMNYDLIWPEEMSERLLKKTIIQKLVHKNAAHAGPVSIGAFEVPVKGGKPALGKSLRKMRKINREFI